MGHPVLDVPLAPEPPAKREPRKRIDMGWIRRARPVWESAGYSEGDDLRKSLISRAGVKQGICSRTASRYSSGSEDGRFLVGAPLGERHKAAAG